MGRPRHDYQAGGVAALLEGLTGAAAGEAGEGIGTMLARAAGRGIHAGVKHVIHEAHCEENPSAKGCDDDED
jgi:hypothetical protein